MDRDRLTQLWNIIHVVNEVKDDSSKDDWTVNETETGHEA